MELRHLSHFLAIVTHGSLGRAAKAMHISEPALSKSIRRLEDDLQVKLLDRGTRGMTPTLFGEALLPRARLVVGEIETAKREMEELRGAGRGIVRVGVRPSFGSTILPRAIARIQAKRSNLQAVIREGFMPTLVSELVQGQLDFIVVSEIEDLDPILTQERLLQSAVGILARAEHKLARKTRLKAADLAGADWIMPLKGDPIRLQLENLLRANAVDPVRVAAESNSVTAIMSYVRETDAIGFFPKMMLDGAETARGLTFLDVPGIVWLRSLNIVRRRRVSLPPAAQLLIGELKRVSEEMGAVAPDHEI